MVEAKGLQSVTRFDGRLHIFQRPRTPFWWCGFHHKGSYVRHSTKERDLTSAIVAAERWYTLQQAEILTGNETLGGRTVGTVAKSALKNLDGKVKRGERSSYYKEQIERIIETRILPFFGSKSVAKIDMVQWGRFREHVLEESPELSRATLHQFKNALRLILNEAYRSGWIKLLPVIKDEYGSAKVKVPRVWFDPTEYRKLLAGIRRHAKTLVGTRWEEDGKELYDYVIFVANSGLRTGEAKNVRFCDVSGHSEVNEGEQRKYLLIRNIRGKRGTGDCRTMDGAVDAFKRIVERRRIENAGTSTEKLFGSYHRDMFNVVLEQTDLKWTNGQPRRKRDLTVLRHTYISFRLLHGASAFDIANNCRTSVQMIQEHYARWLSPQLTKGLNVMTRRAEAEVWR
jgi:integrase